MRNNSTGDKICSFCAEGFYLKDVNANSSGIWKEPNNFCLPCPLNAECMIHTNLETIAIKPGFWRDSIYTKTIYPCRFPQVCVGSHAKVSRQQSKENGRYCKEGHKGPICEVCVESKKYFTSTVGECVHCPSFLRLALIPVILIIIAAIIAIVIYFKFFQQQLKTTLMIISSINLQAKFKVLISFFQVVVTLESVYGVPIHPEFKSWFNFIQIFNFRYFDFVAFPPECFGSIQVRLILSATWPYAMVLIIITGVLLYTLLLDKREKNRILYIKKMWAYSLYVTILVFYLMLSLVCNSIFSAIKCKSFNSHDMDKLTKSYLLADFSIECDKEESIWNIFWGLFVIWPIMVPVMFFILLWSIRTSVRSQRTTVLSEACRFLWRDYHRSMMFWEIFDILRKIMLTGCVMFIDREEGSNKIFRLIVAIAISTLYFGLLALARPFKRHGDLYLAFTSNVCLIGCFLVGIIIQICGKEGGICEGIILSSLTTSYEATLTAVIITTIMLSISILFIIVVTRNAMNAPCICLVQTNNRPNLEMPGDCKYHAFLSHV